MGKSTKWLSADKPDAPAGDFVAAMLEDRLTDVVEALDNVAGPRSNDPEHVHQLRVATRRAGAALSAAKEFLPRRRAKKLRKRLRRIRRAAAAARDLDVLAARYSARQDAAKSATDAALDWLWTQVVSSRRNAEARLEKTRQEFGGGRLERYATRLIARVKWRGKGYEPTSEDLSRGQIGSNAEEFFAAARPHVTGERSQPMTTKQLHAMRIAGKRLRYSLELFAAQLDPRLRAEVYPAMEEIQERLGAINDRSAAAKLIRKWIEKDGASGLSPDAPIQLISAEREAAELLTADFLTWWSGDRERALEATVAGLLRAATNNTD